jgi:phosphatidylglycerol---prolipoprotein diacylglyceryl transferase
MFNYPTIDPVLLSLGPLKIHWYGLMYLLGFAGAWGLGRWRAGRPGSIWTAQQVDDLIFYGALGVILGGRIGYVLFYGLDRLLADPLYPLRVWDGGMSFHGGLLGVLAAMYLYARKLGRPFFQLTDFIAPLVPVGLFTGRIGNFINGELWGKVTDGTWGMRVPCDRYPHLCRDLPPEAAWSLPLHPSQLYQAALEGLALFLLLWLFSARPRPTMAVSGLFLIGYGAFRFGVEFVRTPDAHIGYLAWGWLTLGQLLTLPMLVFGALLMALAYRRRPADQGGG